MRHRQQPTKPVQRADQIVQNPVSLDYPLFRIAAFKEAAITLQAFSTVRSKSIGKVRDLIMRNCLSDQWRNNGGPKAPDQNDRQQHCWKYGRKMSVNVASLSTQQQPASQMWTQAISGPDF